MGIYSILAALSGLLPRQYIRSKSDNTCIAQGKNILYVYNYYLLYTLPLVQWNRLFANSDVPIQSVTNDLLHGKFAMQTYALHRVDVTSELLHSWWFAHVQSNNKTINVWLFV